MPERGLEELVLRDLEQLVARIRLEDLDERLVVVAAAQETRPLDHALRLAPEHRDLPRARAVGGVRVEPEEAPLAGDLAGRVEALDADVVEVRGPVHGRPRVRLRQVEQALLAREPPHLRRQLREAERDRPLVARAQDAEPRAGDGTQHVLPVLGEHVVLAVAEEREVVVAHPLEQVAGLRALVRVDRGRPRAPRRRRRRARASTASPRPRRARRRARGRCRPAAAPAPPGRPGGRSRRGSATRAARPRRRPRAAGPPRPGARA